MSRPPLLGLLAAAAFALSSTTALADTIRVGVIGPFSGPYANQGLNFQAGIEAWFALNGRSVGDDEIEIVYRDLPAADPARARALAQELVVSDGVQYLAGRGRLSTVLQHQRRLGGDAHRDAARRGSRRAGGDPGLRPGHP